MKLSNRLSIYVFVVCLVIGLGITFVLERTVTNNQHRQAERVMAFVQRQLVENFKADIGDVESLVRRSALVLARQGLTTESKDISRLISIMIESDSTIMGGALALNPDVPGRRRCEWMIYLSRDTEGNFNEKLLKSPEYPYAGMRWFRDPVERKVPCWSPVYVDRGAGETSMITYAVPLCDSTGAVNAVITADISLRQLARTVAALKPYSASESYIVDSSDRIMAPGRDVDGKAAAEVGGHDGSNIVTTTPVAGLPMRIMTVTPEASLMTVLQAVRSHLIIIMLCGTIILIILVRTLLWSMTRPLDRLSEAADSIGRGNFSTPLPDVGNYSDLDRLRTAMQHMETSIADYVELTAREARERERIESELKVAADIQRSMLPADPPEVLDMHGARVAIGTFLRPALEVSGDLYFWQQAGDKLFLVIADVSGKGIPASLLMVSLKERLSIDIDRDLSPAMILNDLNDALCRSNPRNMFVTMQICVFDPHAMTVAIANAGHNPPAVRRGGVWRMLPLPAGLPVGIMEGMDYTATSFDVNPGDALFIYTDGLTEAEDDRGTQFGEERLLTLLADTDALPPRARTHEISRRIMAFAPNDAHDDMTMVFSELLAADPRSLILPRTREAVARATGFAAECAARWQLAPKVAYNLELILEEWITDIVEYTPEGYGETVTLNATFNGSRILLTTSYAAPEFNPLAEAPDVDTSAGADERAVGGLGIFLMRGLADEIAHSYRDGHNILEIKINC